MRSPRCFLTAITLLVAFANAISATTAEEISWATDPEQALQEAADSGKPVLMQFTASWCVYCKRMEKSTFTSEEVAERISEDFVAVRVDADKHKDLVNDLEIKGLPAILVVSPDLEILHRISGFQTAEALMTELDKADRAASGTRTDATRVAKSSPAETRAKTTRPTSSRVVPSAAKRSQPNATKPVAETAGKTVRPISRPTVRDTRDLPRVTTDREVAETDAQDPEPAGFSDNVESDDRDAESRTPAKKSDVPRRSSTVDARQKKTDSQPQLSTSEPAFGGMSLVAAVNDRTLTQGVAEFQMRWKGQILYFTSSEELKEFRSEPERYWPMLDGMCPLTLLRTDERVPGKLEFAALFRKRVWLFASEEDMREFVTSPADVSDEVAQLTAK